MDPKVEIKLITARLLELQTELRELHTIYNRSTNPVFHLDHEQQYRMYSVTLEISSQIWLLQSAERRLNAPKKRRFRK